MNGTNVHMYLKCPICFDYYDEPRQLSCGHSFCRKCLEEIRQLYSITCAVCRKPTYLNTTGLAGIRALPTNYPLIQIVEAFVAYSSISTPIDDAKVEEPRVRIPLSPEPVISQKTSVNCGNCRQSLSSDQAWLCADCPEGGLYCASCIIAQHRYHRKCMQIGQATTEWRSACQKFDSISSSVEKCTDQCRQFDILFSASSKPIFQRLENDLSQVQEIRDELTKLYSLAKILRSGQNDDLSKLYRFENSLNRLEFYANKLNDTLPLLIENLHKSNELLSTVEQEIRQNNWKNLVQNFLSSCQETTNVLFYWTEPGARVVALAASFTNWKPTLRLVLRNKEHLATVDLPKGRHEFKFLVDGQWRTNPEFQVCKDGSDNLNNYIVL